LKYFWKLEKELKELTESVKIIAPSPGDSNVARKLARIDNIKNLIANKSFVRNKTCLVLFSYPEQRRFLLRKYERQPLQSIFC